ncbi:MAG: hypothetical protein JXR91_15170, partial [Deltaproteobacteria bacterium]|nr:hypothetical protein [Deltaproteobacteria bacterium]
TMSIKINNSSPLISPSVFGKSSHPSALGKTEKTSSNNPVDEVVKELLSGKINSEEAIDKLIAHTMDSSIVKNSPPALRIEIEEMLKTAIETDPQLKFIAKTIE